MNSDIIDLQTRIAFQESVIEELSDVLTSQQAQLDRLQRQIDKLANQLNNFQEELPMMRQSDEPPPPHY